jgi:hypothetical protein
MIEFVSSIYPLAGLVRQMATDLGIYDFLAEILHLYDYLAMFAVICENMTVNAVVKRSYVVDLLAFIVYSTDLALHHILCNGSYQVNMTCACVLCVTCAMFCVMNYTYLMRACV